MSEAERHRPVLVEEVLRLLDPRSDRLHVDGTVGDAGHARAILEASSPGGLLWGLDRDPEAIERASRALAPFGDRVRLFHESYRQIPELLAQTTARKADAILLDLGASTLQLTAPGRGFSFREPGPLDMRMDPGAGPPAADLLAAWDEGELERILREYGEEPFARRIARAILRARDEGQLSSTVDLAIAAASAVPAKVRHRRIHPATRTFQALRIAVNNELDHLQAFLERLGEALAAGGTLCILTYHSLEDRLVKRAFRAAAAGGLFSDLTRHPLRPGDAEVAQNPRARSAKLRAVRRIA
jgi:16S rRNA (cytosine1402-N4)-methyltransferase